MNIFMLGEELIVYPIFSDEVNDINVYMPKGDWLTFFERKILKISI